MNKSLRGAAALLLPTFLLAAAAQAHVTLDYQAALAGTSYKASFKVGHGCGASATRQLVVEIPAGVRGAHPMPKAGWQLAIDRAAGTSTQPGDVVRITWTAKTPADVLPSAHYDEFVVVAGLPAQPGTLYWPVRQVCEEGRADWVEVPREGQKLSELKSPAALLEVLPGEGGGHVH
jgi:uncharacterized protein YcnI